MNTPMPDATTTDGAKPVFVEPPSGMYEDTSTVWRLLRALNGLRDASRLFNEYLAKTLVEDMGFTRSEV